MVIWGIDTLEFSLSIYHYYECMKDYLETFKELKEQGQETGIAQEIMINGINFTVEKSGAPFYAYRLTCNDFILLVMDKEMNNNYPIKVMFYSGFLWSLEYKESYVNFIEWFTKFNVVVLDIKLSRVDICCDSDKVKYGLSDLKGLTTRAKHKELHYVDDIFYKGKTFSGFTIGKGKPLLCRFYDKTLEIKTSGKVWFKYLWKENGWNGERPVWRVEFQIRRELLKEFNINSSEEFFANQERVWAYLTREWLILKTPGKDNVSRWPIKRKWKVIQDINTNTNVTPLIREKVIEGNLKRLMDQAAGLYNSIGALSNMPDLENTSVYVQEYVKNKLALKKTSFQAEKERRKSKFYSV